MGENLLKPAAKVMANILSGGKARKEINRVPLSDNTVELQTGRVNDGISDLFFPANQHQGETIVE